MFDSLVSVWSLIDFALACGSFVTVKGMLIFPCPDRSHLSHGWLCMPIERRWTVIPPQRSVPTKHEAKKASRQHNLASLPWDTEISCSSIEAELSHPFLIISKIGISI